MNPDVADAIIDFLREIGLCVEERDLSDKTFLPGILVEKGGLIVDRVKLRYPGDLLHEAGHLAVVSARRRADLSG